MSLISALSKPFWVFLLLLCTFFCCYLFIFFSYYCAKLKKNPNKNKHLECRRDYHQYLMSEYECGQRRPGVISCGCGVDVVIRSRWQLRGVQGHLVNRWSSQITAASSCERSIGEVFLVWWLFSPVMGELTGAESLKWHSMTPQMSCPLLKPKRFCLHH